MPASASPAQDRAPTPLDEAIARLRQRARLEAGDPHAASPAQLLEEALQLLESQRGSASALEREMLALRTAQH